MAEQKLLLGVDMGSTTLKCVVLDRETTLPLISLYRRHDGEPLAVLGVLLAEIEERFGDAPVETAFSGSQSSDIAPHCSALYVQEVIAGSIAVTHRYSSVKTTIELGGQDAKLLFFNPLDGGVEDMRMNGVCAGGTGAFLDQIATLIDTPIEEFNALASKGTRVYDISGRCGVFAKTDIQPLLNRGVSRADIALSCFHALVKQTIGGLAQGTALQAPILFAGGPLFFMPRLREVFKEQLNLTDQDIITPEDGDTFVAFGAALALTKNLGQGESQRLSSLRSALEKAKKQRETTVLSQDGARPFFANDQERNDFDTRYSTAPFVPPLFTSGTTLEVYIGIDAGSTTTKFVISR